MENIALATAGMEITKPTPYEELMAIVEADRKVAADIKAEKDRKSQTYLKMENVILEIISVFAFLRSQGMNYREITIAHFKSCQEQMLSMAKEKTRSRPRTRIWWGLKAIPRKDQAVSERCCEAWRHYLKNKFFTTVPDKSYNGYFVGRRMFPRDDVDQILWVEKYRKGPDFEYMLPPNIVFLANEIFNERYGSENNRWLNGGGK